MGVKLSDFINYLLEQVILKSIYCWSAQGQLLSSIDEEWIKKHEDSKSNADKVIKMWKERRNIKGCRAFDCSGLGCYFLYNLHKLIKSDTTAQGLYNLCAKVTKKELQKGDWVFKWSTLKQKCTHVGYVVDDDLNVVEAQGRAYGVVKRPLSKGGWNRYGRPNIAWEKEPEPKKFVLTRLLKKGCRGDDVGELQKRLTALGYPLKADKIFGSKTKEAVVEFQDNSYLKADGIVGKDTCKVLGWIWKG